jgi:transcriptional regulator GlxA family with amidase domain
VFGEGGESGRILRDARTVLASLIARCEPIAQRTRNRAVIWSLSGLRQLLGETSEPLRLADSLIVAGVLAHMLEAAMRSGDALQPVPADLADAHREVVAFIERCAWAAASLPPPETSEPRVDLALAYLRDRYRRPDLSAQDAAVHVGLSRPYLNRLLLETTGRSFIAHLHALRTRDARRLLVTTTLSVKEIADAVGYPDATRFCRHFKEICKTSPAAFRRAAQREF